MDSLMSTPRTCTRKQLVRRHAVVEPPQLNQPDSSRSLPLDEGLAPRNRPRPRIGRPPDADVVAVVVIMCFMLMKCETSEFVGTSLLLLMCLKSWYQGGYLGGIDNQRINPISLCKLCVFFFQVGLWAG